MNIGEYVQFILNLPSQELHTNKCCKRLIVYLMLLGNRCPYPLLIFKMMDIELMMTMMMIILQLSEKDHGRFATRHVHIRNTRYLKWYKEMKYPIQMR